MIKKLRLRNFKNFIGAELELGKINLIYGQNSSGKSSVIQSLLFLKQTNAFNNLMFFPKFSGEFADLGSYFNAIKDHNVEKSMFFDINFNQYQLCLEYELNEDQLATIAKSEILNLKLTEYDRLSKSISDLDFKIIMENLSRNENGEFFMEISLDQIETLDEKIKNSNLRISQSMFIEQYTNNVNELDIDCEENESKIESINSELDNILNKYLSPPINKLSYIFSKIKYIPPVRDIITRYYTESDLINLEEDFLSYISNSSIVQNEINRIFSKLGISYTIHDESLAHPVLGKRKFLFLKDRRGAKLNFQDVGFGLSQILPIVFRLALKNNDECLLIEQPELHLHPKLQGELAEELASFVDILDREHDPLENNQNRQLIIETHSEHIFLRLQRLIRNRKINHNDVKVFYVNIVENDEISNESILESTILEIELYENGDIKTPWPHGFFEEREQEIFS